MFTVNRDDAWMTESNAPSDNGSIATRTYAANVFNDDEDFNVLQTVNLDGSNPNHIVERDNNTWCTPQCAESQS